MLNISYLFNGLFKYWKMSIRFLRKKYTNMWIVDNLSSIKLSNLCYKGSELLTQTQHF